MKNEPREEYAKLVRDVITETRYNVTLHGKPIWKGTSHCYRATLSHNRTNDMFHICFEEGQSSKDTKRSILVALGKKLQKMGLVVKPE